MSSLSDLIRTEYTQTDQVCCKKRSVYYLRVFCCISVLPLMKIILTLPHSAREFLSFPLLQRHFQALYSYTAAEADEVSLQEGDLILDVEQIDEGWVFGCNQRTGKRGMLPANYVRPV